MRDLGRIFDVSKPWLNRVIERAPRRLLTAAAEVTFSIGKRETFALVGESGSGKSTVAKMVVGLIPPTTGEVIIDGVSMSNPKDDSDRRRLRRRIQMVFQDPYASLNPRWRALDIVAEPIRAFGIAQSDAETTRQVGDLLRTVGLDPADGAKYPHEFSGGQRQRIAIARALASKPEFIVCDEPTSALDVSVQAQILNLMRDLQDRFGLTYLFISHNLAVVRHMANRIGVMYLGRLVEVAPARELFRVAEASLHAHAARRGAGPRSHRPPAQAGRGRGAEPGRSAARLPVPSALPVGVRPLPYRAAAAAPGRRRHGRLPRRAGRADFRARDLAWLGPTAARRVDSAGRDPYTAPR